MDDDDEEVGRVVLLIIVLGESLLTVNPVSTVQANSAAVKSSNVSRIHIISFKRRNFDPVVVVVVVVAVTAANETVLLSTVESPSFVRLPDVVDDDALVPVLVSALRNANKFVEMILL